MANMPKKRESSILVDVDVDFDDNSVPTMDTDRACSNNRSDVEHVKQILSQQEGDDGKIQLVKNEQNGIATIILDNPRKRNALSGKMIYKTIRPIHLHVLHSIVIPSFYCPNSISNLKLI